MMSYLFSLIACIFSTPCNAAAPHNRSLYGGPPTAELFSRPGFSVDPATGCVVEIKRNRTLIDALALTTATLPVSPTKAPNNVATNSDHRWTDAVSHAAAALPASYAKTPASPADLPDVIPVRTRDPKTLTPMPPKEDIAVFCASRIETPSLKDRRQLKIPAVPVPPRTLTFVQRLPNPPSYLEKKYAATLDKSRATLAHATATLKAAHAALTRTELDIRYAYTLRRSREALERANDTLRRCKTTNGSPHTEPICTIV